MPAYIVDMHTHVCPARFNVPAALQANPRLPCMCATAPGAADMMIEGKLFRKLDARSWDISRRLEDMDQDNIAVQVLSPMPELLSYWFTPEDGAMICDYMNGVIGEMIAAAPARFRGLGMVPLQRMDAAIASLCRVKENHGFSGIQIGTNINGALLGDQKFDPFWEAAQALDLAIFIHPLHPITSRAIQNAPPFFDPLIGFPADTAMAGGSLLLGGVLERFPSLRIGLSHGGGGLVPVVHRLNQAWASMPAIRAKFRAKPGDTAKNFFYDTNVYDLPYLSYFAETFAPHRVFLGTDYPYEIMQTKPADYLAALPVSTATQISLANGAAGHFLNDESLVPK